MQFFCPGNATSCMCTITVQDSAALPNQRANITPRDFLVFLTASCSPGQAKLDKSTPPYDIDASPYRSPTSLFLCITAQWPFCPQQHFTYQQVHNGSYANIHCVPSGTLSTNRYKTALTPTFIVSPATHQVVQQHGVSVLCCISVVTSTRKYIVNSSNLTDIQTV